MLTTTHKIIEPTCGRYHLIVSLGCPFSHRTVLARQLKGLCSAISMDVVHPHMDRSFGWEFREQYINTYNDYNLVSQFYDKNYTGTKSIPVLLDKTTGHIVSNDSAEIVEIMNSDFNELADNPDLDLFPCRHGEVQKTCSRLHSNLNSAVMQCGMATNQSDYDKTITRLFDTLDGMEKHLISHKFLCSDDHVTAADLFAFPTLYRFDAVYAVLFKCTKRRLVDYNCLWKYAQRLHKNTDIRVTCSMSQIMEYYYTSYQQLNPNGIIPVVPDVDWST